MILCELYSIGIRTRWAEIYTFTEEQPGRDTDWGWGWVCACHSKLNLNPIVNSNSNSNRDGMEWKCVTGLCCVFYTRFIIEPIRGLVRAGGGGGGLQPGSWATGQPGWIRYRFSAG